VSARASAEEKLKALAALPDEAVDIAEGALAFAVLARPTAQLAPYRAHLAELAHAVGEAARGAGAGVAGRIETINRVLFASHGYRGDGETYDDLENANLIRVIDRRKGLPVALGVIYMHAARAQGWPVVGLNFPGHFLVRIDDGAQRAIVDPFHGGRVCEAADLRDLLKATSGADAELTPRLYEPVGNRQVLLRLQSNVTARLARAGRLDEAVASLNAQLLLAPEEGRLWFERGAYQVRLGNVRAAIESLEAFVARAGTASARREAETLIAGLRRRLN
jgi:regulator of sirC expression with transglutaminase-like and TPR domain